MRVLNSIISGCVTRWIRSTLYKRTGIRIILSSKLRSRLLSEFLSRVSSFSPSPGASVWNTKLCFLRLNCRLISLVIDIALDYLWRSQIT